MSADGGVVDRQVPRWLARTLGAIALAAVVGVLVVMWPMRLGGATELLAVHGDSMAPTFDGGDILVVRRSGDYRVGQNVAFQVPSGPAAGLRIVHRIVAVDPVTGAITTRGDNRLDDDNFAITAADVDGRVVARLPGLGQVLFVMSRWWFLAPVLGLLTVLVLWPRAPGAGAVAEDPAA